MSWTPTPWPTPDWERIYVQLRGLEQGLAIGTKERAEKQLAKLKVILEVNKISIDETDPVALRIIYQAGRRRISLVKAYEALEERAHAQSENQTSA